MFASLCLLYTLMVVCMERLASFPGPAQLSIACSRPEFTITSHLAPGNEGMCPHPVPWNKPSLTPSTWEQGEPHAHPAPGNKASLMHTQYLGTSQASHPAPGNKASPMHTQHLGTRRAPCTPSTWNHVTDNFFDIDTQEK